MLYGVLALAVLFAFVAGMWKSRLADGPTPLGYDLFLGLGALALAAAVMVLTLMLWKRLDEAAREAHKWAWYWGSPFGLVLMVAIMAGEPVQLARRLGFNEPEELIHFGSVTVLTGMLAGYLVAWALWWLRRR